MFKMQRDSDNLNINLTDLFVGEWDNSINGASAWKWGKRVEPGNDSAMGIEACWNPIGIVEPMGSRDMTDEEKEVSHRLLCRKSFIINPLVAAFHVLCQLSSESCESVVRKRRWTERRSKHQEDFAISELQRSKFSWPKFSWLPKFCKP